MSIDSATVGLWKNHFSESAIWLQEKYAPWDPSVKNEFEIEKHIFYGFYGIRKLQEDKHLNNSANALNFNIYTYPVIENIDFEAVFNEKWHNAYNFIQGKKEQLSLKDLSNLIIHSRIYSPFVVEELGVMGIYFSSDNTYKTKVYYIQLIKIIELFRSVAEDRLVKLKLDTSIPGKISIVDMV